MKNDLIRCLERAIVQIEERVLAQVLCIANIEDGGEGAGQERQTLRVLEGVLVEHHHAREAEGLQEHLGLVRSARRLSSG